MVHVFEFPFEFSYSFCLSFPCCLGVFDGNPLGWSGNLKQKNEGANSSSWYSSMCFHAVLHSGSFGRYLSLSSVYRSGCSIMSPCVWDSMYVYLGVGGLVSMSMVESCVIVVVCGWGWSEDSSSVIVAQLFCSCWVCVYINSLWSCGVCGACPGSLIFDFRSMSNVVSISIGICAS